MGGGTEGRCNGRGAHGVCNAINLGAKDAIEQINL